MVCEGYEWVPSAQVTLSPRGLFRGLAEWGQGKLPSTSHCLFCVLQEMANSVYLVMEVSSCRPGCKDREDGPFQHLDPLSPGAGQAALGTLVASSSMDCKGHLP